MKTYAIGEEFHTEECGDVDSVVQRGFNDEKKFSMDFSWIFW